MTAATSLQESRSDLRCLPVERLAGRYDLLTRVASGHGRALWQGHDTVLDRAVGVLVLESDDPRGDDVRRAAQRAACAEHPNLQRVVDVDVIDGRVFVVTQWSAARTLAELLVAQPLSPPRAVWVVARVARALEAADAAGVHHLVLDPRDVLVGEDEVTVAGLGVRAAVHPEPTCPVDVSGSPGQRDGQCDARRLGALLYAALTSRWPGGDCAGLSAAPTVDGRLCRPRQVRAGVPPALDVIAWRALGHADDGRGTLDTPAEVASALAEQELRPATDAVPGTGSPGLPPTAWAGLFAIAALLALGVGLLGWQVWRGRSQPPPIPISTPTDAPSAPTSPPPEQLGVVPVAAARAYDPQGDGVENDDETPLAIDGDLTTAWTTVTYATRDLGGLKRGVGLQLRLQRPSDVEGIDVQLVGRGTDLRVYTARGRPSSLRGYRLAAEVVGAGDQLTLRFAPPKAADTILLWLTGLPPTADGFQGGVSEVVVRGS